MKELSSISFIKPMSTMAITTFITQFINLIRNKIFASLAGLLGVGLFTTYSNYVNLGSVISLIGLPVSSVRKISSLENLDNLDQLSAISSTLRISSFLFAAVLCLIIFITQVLGNYYFLDFYLSQQDLIFVALSIIFTNLSSAEQAIFQGLRRIDLLSRSLIFGTLFGLFGSIVCVYILGSDGIALAIFLAAFLNLLVVYFFALKTGIGFTLLSLKLYKKNLLDIVPLGIVMTLTSGLSILLGTIVIVFITKTFDIESVGIYGASLAISGMFSNFLITSMGADYYPRLSSSINSFTKSTEIINKQISLSLIIAFPIFLFVFLFSDFLIILFYNSEFLDANHLVKWFLIGSCFRLISWPMGYVLIVKNSTILLLGSELFFWLFHLLMIYFFINLSGLKGIAIAFSTNYALHTFVMYFFSKKLINFSLNYELKKNLCIYLPVLFMMITTLLFPTIMSSVIYYYLSLIILIIVSSYSISKIYNQLRDGT